jgi:pimeloyl-ACP methyl ester carboxylesterase
MPTVSVDDGAIFYTEHGSGPAVLLVHGWGCDGNDWSWLACDLSADHRVICVDLRGHGRSSTGVDRYGPQVLAADLATLLEHLAIPRTVVIGHSMGGYVASVLSIEFAEKVSALVLIDPGYGKLDASVDAMQARMDSDPLAGALHIYSDFDSVNSPAWQRLWHERRLLGMPPSTLAKTFSAMWAPGTPGRRSSAVDYLARRSCPVLAVYAEARAETCAWERTLRHGPHDQTVLWDGVGHFLHQERPTEFARLARDWLATV